MIVIADAFAQNAFSGPATVGGTGTSADLFAQANNSAAPFALTLPPDILNGQVHYITAAGFVFVHGTSPTLVVSLYGNAGGVPASSPLTAGSWTVLGATSSATSLTTAATYPWKITAELSGDSASGILQGSYKIVTDNTLKAEAALNNVLTGVVFNSSVGVSATPYSLALGLTFGVSDAQNKGTLTEFKAGV